MTQEQPKPKFSSEYKVVLFAVILRAVEKEASANADQRTRDAKHLAFQQLRTATDEVMR